MYRNLNLNPENRRTDDCVIRAIATAMQTDWETIYDALAKEGRKRHDMMNANHVWIGWLKDNGFRMRTIPDICPNCYTLRDFCVDHPDGTFIVGTGSHVVAVIDGDYYDSWNSGDVVPIFYFRR